MPVHGLPTGREIEERATRSRVLREAWQPLARCVSADEWRAGQQRLGALDGALDALADHVRSARAAGPSDDAARSREVAALRHAAAEIDARLANEAVSILGALDRATPARRRAAWFEVGTAPPEGAAGLLDLVLEDEAKLAPRLPLLEDLVLLLATDEQQGVRRIVRDPATLTARLRTVCERSANAAGGEIAAAENALLEAARRCEREPTDSAARTVEELRRALGSALLAPRLLRALIFFDAVLWSQLARFGDTRPAPAAGGADGRRPASGPAGSAPSGAASARERGRRETLAASRGGTPGASARPPSAASSPPDRAVATVGDGDVAPAPGAVRWRLDERPAPPPPPRRRRNLRPLAAAVGIAACTGVGLFAWIDSAPTLRSLPRSQLQSVSMVLDSGYRDQRGAGPLFVGTVGEDWEMLPPEQRERSAREIIDHMTGTGVREIVLYGAERRIAMHYADGLPLRILP